MSIPLVEALQQVELETGKTYRCEIRGRLIEVRVLDLKPEGSALAESDIMLDPWVKLPRPAPVAQGRSTLGEPRPPSVPDIPAEDEPRSFGVLLLKMPLIGVILSTAVRCCAYACSTRRI